MKCCDCQTKFCELSAEVLDSKSVLELREHLEQCDPCRCEWILFERCLSLISTVPQPLPTPLATEQMWHRCFEHIFVKVEAARAGRSSQAEYSSAASNSATAAESRGWFLRQPRWSWAVFGASLMILAGAWLAVPRDTVEAGAQFVESPATPGQLVMMQRPPAVAAGLVNHHSAMNVDPFTDYVGSTMVSYSATSARR